MNNSSIFNNKIQNEMIEPLLDLLDDGVIVHDDNRKILFMNVAASKITGFTLNDVLGKDCHNAFPPKGLCLGSCAFKKGPADSARNSRELNQNYVRKDGRELRVQIKSTPVVINGKDVATLVLIRDISDLNELNWRLKRGKNFHGMIGVSKSMVDIFETIRSVGSSDYPVLITGESGTGKELVARAIHLESSRSSGPFVPVNCGALPENILESELFGHVRGAFTGAIKDKKGRFELAEGGTLFLDEVGEMPQQMQVKLLRVLQEKVFERVGGEQSIRSDVRILAATNSNLEEMIKEGTFREDFYYRLCVVPITLPPLRDRVEDIPYVINNILSTISKETGNSIKSVEDSAMDKLVTYNFPGNIRQLINALQYATVRSGADNIKLEYLPFEIQNHFFNTSTKNILSSKKMLSENSNSENENVDKLKNPRKKLSEEAVIEALKKTGGNRAKAATLLGVGRATLYRFFDKINN
ncbi:MAG: sigma 54-interacting transcriptional regulator [Deltaproteobacteria bacterium]|nr:sigma 54-interacting transcriptional regulator [Deltaproteobacteria bacterium]